jgi:membrane protein
LPIAVAAALWSASAYITAFKYATNAIYGVEERRPLSRTIPARVGMSVVMLLLLTLTAVIVGLAGPLARGVGNLVGLGHAATDIWAIAKWPLVLVLVTAMLAFLYWAAPNVEHPRFRWVTPGSALAVLLWAAGSAIFSLFVANFGAYNRTYGALAGVIVFLIWVWLSNLAALLGAAFNAELER